MLRAFLLLIATVVVVAGCDDEAEDVPADAPTDGPSATADPTPTADPLAFLVQDNEVGFNDPVIQPYTVGCWSDAEVVVENGRVIEIVRKAHKLPIEVGEEVIGPGGVAEARLDDEFQPVFRDDSGALRSGYKRCDTSVNCFADGQVQIQNGVVIDVSARGEFPAGSTEILVGEPVRSDLPLEFVHAIPVVRMADGVLEFGVKYCDGVTPKENDWPYLWEPDNNPMIPAPPILGSQEGSPSPTP